MKTKEELNALKEEFEALNKKLAELTEDELKQVAGGRDEHTIPLPGSPEFWQSWNPGFPTNIAHPDMIGFIDSDDYTEKVTFE